MPTPTERHRRLAALAGDWTGDETLYPSPWSPEQRSASGRFTNRISLDGFFLINDYVEERDGEVVFRGHGVYGWDPNAERYTMHWFDSMGGDPGAPALGVWEGDTLTFRNQGPHGAARYVYTFAGANQFSFRIEASKDGESWSTMMEGQYARVSE